MANKKILYVVIVVLVIGGGLFFFLRNKGMPTSTTDKKVVDLTKKIPNLTILKTKQPKPDTQLAVTNTINAVKGGKISLYDSKGVEIKLSIPAGSLEKDTSITLSPLQEVPIENYTSKLGNGVLIEPEGLKFSKNATLIFDFKPGKIGQPSETLNTLPKKAGIVHVDSVKDRVNNTHAFRSKYGSRLLASIDSLSSFIPDDLSGSNGGAVAESELLAAADLGVCSQQFLNAATKIIEDAQAVGDNETANGVYGVLEDCGKRAVDDLENKCKENPMQLRRRDFVNVMEMVQAIGPISEALRAEKLMMDCRREYNMVGSKSIGIDQGVSTYSIDAKLCGYLDEQWEGTEIADYLLAGYAHQRYTGAINFTLPRGGGDFDMSTTGELLAQSKFTADMTFPFSGQGQLAFYDGQKKITVFYEGYGVFGVDAPITVKDNKCTTTNEELNQAGW